MNKDSMTAPTPNAPAGDTLGEIDGPYPVAARVIWLHLEEFCDWGMTVPDMIAEAARRANREIVSLRAELLTARRGEEARETQQSRCVHWFDPMFNFCPWCGIARAALAATPEGRSHA